MHNILIGKMYFEVRGKSQIVNHTTGEHCDMEWKERSWSGKNANMFAGLVKTAEGEAKFRVHGKFVDSISI